ncbi:MAG: hypothetical protein J7M18_03085, partial [Candidatus Eremiobacteraeota bacterium]|nr:hypothetical protein [Candidatus Eremiobacteraeota bacterium]
MARRTKYREERTLVRGLRRLPNKENHKEFKDKVLRLHRHFIQFNVDVSELCQWMMRLGPSGNRPTKETYALFSFILEPGKIIKTDKSMVDRNRRLVFDVVSGIENEESLLQISLPLSLLKSIQAAKSLTLTETSKKLFSRLALKDPSYRQVLLKSASEWIVAHYLRGYENYKLRRKEWENEKKAWENSHPELTEEVRDEFTNIFKQLKIKRKNPRVCKWERLKQRKDNCEYNGEKAGQKKHASLCAKYKRFFDKKKKTNPGFKKHFVKDAEMYIKMRNSQPGSSKEDVMKQLLEKLPPEAANWFPGAWNEYLKALEMNEQTLLEKSRNG